MTPNTIKIHIPEWWSRSNIRYALMEMFCDEPAGSGKWIYYVDKTPTVQLYIVRPTALNKGMDFEIRTEGLNFINRNKLGKLRPSNRPSHETILQDLAQKKAENQKEYAKLLKLIACTYDCKRIPQTDLKRIHFKIGYPTDAVLKVLRWMFIEQDITYWNWSGRKMLFDKILKVHEMDAAKNFIGQFEKGAKG